MKYWVWLSQIPGLGPIKKKKLLEKYKTPEKIYMLKKEELLKNKGIGEELANNILDRKYRENLDKHLEYMRKNNIEIISIYNKYYPEKLKQIYDSPISLYVKGNYKILNNLSIAIVGCREATEYGKKAAKYFSYSLTKEGINIVSGLARGIDSFSHIGAICGKLEENTKNVDNLSTDKKRLNIGNTIAVVGTGLDRVYPDENRYLEEQIIKTGGAVISEYPLGTKPEKMNFPARNRIISGISSGVLVVEAKEKSGTLITVDFALEQGRDVFVVPGNINSINSVGTNNLIKQGAKLVTNYKEIILNLRITTFPLELN